MTRQYIKSCRITHIGTTIKFTVPPFKVWHWIPGSVYLSKTNTGRKMLFPVQYNVDQICDMLEQLPQRDPSKYTIDLRGEVFFPDLSILYRRKSYRLKPSKILPPKGRMSTVKTEVDIVTA